MRCISFCQEGFGATWLCLENLERKLSVLALDVYPITYLCELEAISAWQVKSVPECSKFWVA